MKTRTSATLVLLATFLLGGITGAVGYYLYARRVGATGRDGGRPSPHHIVEELARALTLDASQKEKLQAIITESRERYRALSDQVRPQYDEIRRQTREQIRQILREDQKPGLEEFFRELDKRRSNRPPPHPPENK